MEVRIGDIPGTVSSTGNQLCLMTVHQVTDSSLVSSSACALAGSYGRYAIVRKQTQFIEDGGTALFEVAEFEPVLIQELEAFVCSDGQDMGSANDMILGSWTRRQGIIDSNQATTFYKAQLKAWNSGAKMRQPRTSQELQELVSKIDPVKKYWLGLFNVNKDSSFSPSSSGQLQWADGDYLDGVASLDLSAVQVILSGEFCMTLEVDASNGNALLQDEDCHSQHHPIVEVDCYDRRKGKYDNKRHN